MKRLLTWVLVLVMCAMPLSGLGEQTLTGRLYTLSVGNVSFSLNGSAEQTIGATLNVRGGAAEDGRFLLGVDALGGDATIGQLTLTGNEEDMTAYLNGMSSAYGVTAEDIQRVMAQSAQSAGVDVPQTPSNMDMDALQGMIEGYVGMLMDLSDPEKVAQMNSEEVARQVMAAYGVDMEAEAAMEEITLFGEQVTLPRYDTVVTVENMDQLVEVMRQVTPNYAKFFDNYMKFVATAVGYEMSEPASFAQFFQALGMDMTMDMTIWGEMEGELARTDAVMHMSVTEDGRTFTQDMPVTVEVMENDGAAKMTMTMENADVSMKMDMDATEENGVSTMQMNMDMTVEDETVTMAMDFTADTSAPNACKVNGALTVGPQDQQVRMALDLTSEKAEDGAEHTAGTLTIDAAGEQQVVLGLDNDYRLAEDGTEAMDLTLTATAGGAQMGAINLNYAGEITKGDGHYARGGRLNLSGQAMDQSFTLGMDLNYRHEPLTEEMLGQLDALTRVDLMQAVDDKEAMQQAELELETVMMTALGGLMQTPGVAEIIAQMMVAQQNAASDYGDYGYDDYGYGYDQEYDQEGVMVEGAVAA